MDTSTLSFFWDLGNGTTSNSYIPVPTTYTNSGGIDSTYLVQLITTNAFGCSDTISDSIVIRANPVANFNSISYLECAPFTLDSNNISWQDFPTINNGYVWQILNPKDSVIATGDEAL